MKLTKPFDENKYLFHVHTYRCGHAQEIPDEKYIEKAVMLGAESIYFSDHAPFPEDPFGNRMKMAELDEYVKTLTGLKQKYKGIISVYVGLEIEYFPSFDDKGYYKSLKKKEGIDFLLLGQHMSEIKTGKYSFDLSNDELKEREYKLLGEAIIQGMKSGHFDMIAHPDRIYRRRKEWDDDMANMAERIISLAFDNNIPLEQNEASKIDKHHFWEEFWELNNGRVKVVHGLDAHSLEELKIVE